MSTKKQVNVRLDEITRRRIAELQKIYGTVTNVIEIAIAEKYASEIRDNDQWRQFIAAMNECSKVNENEQRTL